MMINRRDFYGTGRAPDVGPTVVRIYIMSGRGPSTVDRTMTYDDDTESRCILLIGRYSSYPWIHWTK